MRFPEETGAARPRVALWVAVREPFAREGLFLRTWPFALALALGLLIAALENGEDRLALRLATALTVLVVVAVAAAPWSRLPRAAQVAPALACLPVVALLRETGGGATSGFAPLVLIPVFWLAIYGNRRVLGLAIVGMGLTLGLPLVLVGAPQYPAEEWTRLVLWVLLGGMVGLTVQQLVAVARQGARTGAALTTAIVESALDCVMTMDHRGRVVEFNPAAERTFGYRREEAVGAELAALIVPPSLREAHRKGLARYMAGGDAQVLDRRLELTAMRSDGDEFPVELTITRIAGVQPPMFTGYVRDVTERRRAERDAAARHGVARVLAESPTVDAATPQLLRALGQSMDWDLGAMWLVDEEAGVLRCETIWHGESTTATAFRELTAVLTVAPGQGPLGRAWDTGAPASSQAVADERDDPRADAAVRDGLRAGLWLPIRSGAEVLGVLEFSSRAAHHLDEPLMETLADVGSQIGEFVRRRRAEERLAHQALHDDLTGLPNRGLLLDRLAHALERSKRRGTPLAVLFMDLDHFKVVNDSLGHHVGDELLLEVAARLQRVLRRADTVGRIGGETVARFGGDEFVVLCEDLAGEGQALLVAERISHALAEPVVLGGQELVVSASIGLAVGTGGHATPETLVRDADAAMYRAKEQGRGRCEVFDHALRSRMLDRLASVTELRRAVDGDELRLVYQPIVTVADGAVHAVEALARWQHPVRGLVGPDEFIPVAEESGLILRLGRWVLGEACRQAAEWGAEWGAGPAPRVSVNLSARQLADRDLVEHATATLRATGLPPDRLALGITESLLMHEVGAAIETLRELKALGVRLHLDDFGTGYSSLSYLKRFPLDALKLDRSFIAGLGADTQESAIVAAVVEMARALGLTVIAEGVETEEQLASLRALGCELAQGYYFAAPMPAPAAAAFLRARS